MIFLLQLLHCDVVFVVLGNGFRTGFVVSRIDMAEVAVLAEICQLLLTHLMINRGRSKPPPWGVSRASTAMNCSSSASNLTGSNPPFLCAFTHTKATDMNIMNIKNLFKVIVF